MTEILSALGLSAATGLNAYLPLLIVGLLARFTDWITLKAPWNTLENVWVLLILAVLLFIETVVDKIPALDTVNDTIQTFIRPVAGAILFLAGSNIISDFSPVAGIVCGILVAGSVHAAKASARPMITAGTGGMGNPVVSVVEDIISGISTLAAIVIPMLAAILFAVLLALLIGWKIRRRRHKAANAQI